MAKQVNRQGDRPGTLRRGLMLYGSTAALAAALMLAEGGVGPAAAQSIGPRVVPTEAAQGNFTVPDQPPSPFFEYRSATLDIINMNRDAVLNWSTYDGAAPGGAQGNSYVNFLPIGAELRFVGNGQSFTAINRVFTTPNNAGAYRGIAIQGRVTSYLFGDGPNSVGPVGGNIWFYSPGGILATGSASFNVGSLLLSASDLDNFIESGSSRTIDFTGVTDAFASVILKSGSRVTLTQPGSSFAIVAPTIEQGGDVTVNGSALYLSAETGSLSFSDIGTAFGSISADAQAGNEIRHLGTTTGPASIQTDDFSVLDPQTIEFRTGRDVRVLLSGAIGYAPATNAALAANGTIILTAGEIATTGDLAFNSTTFMEASEVSFTANTGDALTMSGDANGAYFLDVSANSGGFAAGAGGLIDIAGDVVFSSLDSRAVYRITAAGAGGPNIPGGQINIGGDLYVNSSESSFGSSQQQGGDIEVAIGDGGRIAVGGSLSLFSDGFAAEDANGVTFAIGGRAVLAMTGANASLSVGESLTLSAQARPFFQNCECVPPGGGFAIGGNASLTATGGTIGAGSVSVSASAEAYASFYVAPGASLDATGGNAVLALGDSSASFSSVSVRADARGARSRGDTDGGAALGGTARFSKDAGGSLAIGDLVVSAEATGGAGSPADGESFAASRGGDAEGGLASIGLGQNAAGLSYLDLSASAQAGNGGSGAGYSAENGGDGGNAIGGTATLALSGVGNNLAGVFEGGINVSAIGGNGGNGEADFDNDIQGGDGGSGGTAQGGTLAITAADGAQFASNLSFGVETFGGSGGRGGNQTFGEGGPSGIGAGGSGGDAIGATVSLTADGGSIAGDLYLDVRGEGGVGGLNGQDFNGNFTGNADFGESRGGAITLTVRDNEMSRFDVGSAVLDASGDVAGLIAVVDESTAPGAGMRFSNLAAEAQGAPAGAAPSFRLSSVRNPIEVDGTAEIYAQSIVLDFAGSGRFAVGGFTFLVSDSDIAISHADNPGVLSVHSSGPVEIYANGDYDSGAGSVVASGDYALIRTLGSIAAADTRSLASISMSAEGDVTVGSVTASENFELFAGRLEFDGGHAYQPGARATVTGTVSAGGSVLVESGGFAEFASGSSVLSDNNIVVRTGDDIVVASGASLASDIDPDEFLSMHLLAGDIDFGPLSGDLIDPITTPIASLRIAGSLDTNGASLYLRGDAIDATGSAIVTRNLYVDVTDAPPFGPFSNDGGALGPNCRQGSACLGSITADGEVAIGLDSNNGLISLRTGAIDFTGDVFDVETLDRLELNADNIPSNLTASNRISLRSVFDAVALTGIALEAPTLRLQAGTDLAAGTASLASPNTIEIAVGNDIAVGTIVAGHGLDDGSGSETFATPGDFLVDSLTFGGTRDIRISAADDLSLGFADPVGQAIDLAAGNVLFLGTTPSGAGAIRLQGESVAFDNLGSYGLVSVTAGPGGITGLPIGGAAINTAAGIALESTGDIAVGDLFAGTDIAIFGAALTTGLVSADGALAITAQGAGSVASFSSGGFAVFSGASFDVGGGFAGDFLAIQATDGDLSFGTLGALGAGVLEASGALLGGDIGVGGALTLIGGSMAIGGAEGAAGVDATVGGNANFVALSSSAGAIAVTADNDIAGGVIDAARDVGLYGGNVSVANVSAGGDLLVDGLDLQATTLAAGGDMALTLESGAFLGTATAGGNLALSAIDGGITAASLTAINALTVTSQSPAVIGEAVAGSDLTIDVGALEATSLVAGGAMTIDAAAGASVAQASAGGSFVFTGSGLTAGVVDAGDRLDVTVLLAASLDSFASGGDATLSGASLDLGNGEVGGALTARSLSGDLRFDDLEVVGDASLSAAQALTGGNALGAGRLTLTGASIAIGTGSGNNGVTATTPGSASFAALASSGGNVALDAGGVVAGSAATASGSVSVAGASVALDNAGFGSGLSLTARSGAISGGGLYQGTGAVSLQAAQGIAIGSVDTLGAIAMTAGTEARFVELRSRDGSVGVNAAAGIVGSSVAATGSDPAGDDSVSLVAGGAIALDGVANALNPVSRAQDDFTVRAGGAVTIVRAEAGRDLTAEAGAGTLGAANLASGRDLSLTGPAVQLAAGNVARNLTVRATAGDITGSGTSTAGGAVDIDATGNIAIGSLAATGGNLTADAGGTLAFTDLTATGSLAVAAGGAVTGSALTAGSGVTAQGASLALGNVGGGWASAVLEASGGPLSADVVSGSSVRATAPGAIALTGLIAGSAIVQSSGGAVSAIGVAVSGLLDARGTVVTLAAPGALRVDARASAGNVGITTGGDLRVNGTATGDIALASTSGSVIIGNVGQSGSVPGGVSAEAVNGGGAVAVAAADAITVGDSLTAGGALAMTAGGLVSLDGSATGQTIALRAADLAIGPAGSLGNAATQRISLASSAPINLGTGASGGFAVDAAEFARIQTGGDLMVSALAGSGSGAGSLTVGALPVNAGSGGQIGAAGTFGLTAAGVLDVNNTLSIARAGSGNTLSLTGDAVDLDYANAALSVLDGSGAATGRIVVNGRLITSMSASAAADIVGKTPAEINLRLGQADGTREVGLFRTGNLTLEGRDAILIQNSGGAAADARRGLNVGALTVTGAANGSTLMVINGIVNNATGNNAAQNVTVTNALAAGSSVNGCVLANIAACFVVIAPEPLIVPPDSVLFGTTDFIKDENEDDEVEDGAVDGETEAPPIDTTRIDDPAGLPMLDDPVTGAGNEDLWQLPDD